ncbi:hypothetical protein Tco_1326358 [Tanacetum coccineum]
MGESSANPTDPHHTPTIIQPSKSQPQKKQKPKKPKRKDIEEPQPSGPIYIVADEAVYEEMDDSLERAATTATSLDTEQDRGNINKTQSKATLNVPSSLGTISSIGPRRQETMGDTIAQTGFENVSKLSNDPLLTRVQSSEVEGLGEEDASKHGRIVDIDADVGINLVSTHFDADTYMFGVHDLVGDEVVVETEVASKDVNLSVDEVTLAQALAALKSAKPKAGKVMLQEPEQGTITTTTAATIVTVGSTRPKAKWLVIHKEEQATTLTVSFQQPSQVKLQAGFDEELRLAREKAKKEEETNIVSWDNVQELIDVDYQMAQQMQAEEQEKLTMRAQEKRNKPPTKAQKRNTMSTYLKNMAGYKNNQLKNIIFDDIQKLFDKAMKRVNIFVDMETELVEGSEQKVDEDKETTKFQRLIEVVHDKEEVAIAAIPLVTKPPSIVDYKIHKEGKKTYYQVIKADGSSKMYLVFRDMLKSFDREDLETLWKLVKAKHRSTRLEEGFERVL